MLNETAVPLEGLPAHLTLVRLLPGVNSLVLNGGDLLSECITTLLTLVGSLPGVNPLVDDKQ